MTKRKPSTTAATTVEKRLAVAKNKLNRARDDVNMLTRQLRAVRLNQSLRWRLHRIGVDRERNRR